jgi:hypothetical protein
VNGKATVGDTQNHTHRYGHLVVSREVCVVLDMLGQLRSRILQRVKTCEHAREEDFALPDLGTVKPDALEPA